MAAKKRFANLRFDRLDAGENAFFERELEAVVAESYDVKYPDLLARQLIPSGAFGASSADEIFTWRQFDLVGQADLVTNYADDVPMVDILGNEYQTKIFSYGDGFQYNVQELKAGAKVGRPLDRDRAVAARTLFEQRIDKIGALGDSRVGVLGLLNQSNTVTYTLPNGGTSGTKPWAGKTGLEIADDIAKTCTAIISATKNTERPDTIAIPSAQHGLISTKPLQSGSDTTILKHVLANSPWIKEIVPWDRCAGAGASSTDRMVAYKKDPSRLKLVVTQEYEVQPPEQRNLSFKVAGYGRTCGVVVHYPKSICYADGL